MIFPWCGSLLHHLSRGILMVPWVPVCSVAQPGLTLKPDALWLASLLCPWNFPGKNTGVGWHFLLQGIFLTWGSNPHLFTIRTTWEAWSNSTWSGLSGKEQDRKEVEYESWFWDVLLWQGWEMPKFVPSSQPGSMKQAVYSLKQTLLFLFVVPWSEAI